MKKNLFELGMDRLFNLDMEADFVGKSALTRIRKEVITQLLVGLAIEGARLAGSNDEHWPIIKDGQVVGRVTSAI